MWLSYTVGFQKCFEFVMLPAVKGLLKKTPAKNLLDQELKWEPSRM